MLPGSCEPFAPTNGHLSRPPWGRRPAGHSARPRLSVPPRLHHPLVGPGVPPAIPPAPGSRSPRGRTIPSVGPASRRPFRPPPALGPPAVAPSPPWGRRPAGQRATIIRRSASVLPPPRNLPSGGEHPADAAECVGVVGQQASAGDARHELDPDRLLGEDVGE